MPRTEKTLEDKYKTYLIKLKSFNNCIQYELYHDFTNEELGDITPPVTLCYICLKVYGKPDSGPNENTTQGHSQSIAYANKDISYFMPNRLVHWN